MLVEKTTDTKPKGVRRSHAARWIAIAVAIVLAGVIIDLIIILRHWPFTEKALTKALQKPSGTNVRISKFHETYFPPGCVAEDVTFVRNGGADQKPLIAVQKLAIRGNWADVLTFRQRIAEVRVIGMHVLIPPREAGSSGGGKPMQLTDGKSKKSMEIGKIVADGALLEFLPREQGKEPYKLAVQKLAVTNVGSGAPMFYRATLMNSKPPGEIRSTGKFGPWNPDDPSRTPVSGSFTYEHANLGISQNVSGILDGKGTFNGQLDHINVRGSTDIPDFHVTGSSHKRRLTTNFEAVVNGTDGDTSLTRVEAQVGRTTGLFTGAVAGEAGHKGKTISLDASVKDGRIEDLLLIFVGAKRAPMDGEVSLHATIRVPPGPRKFKQKLLLTGDFGIAGGHFTKRSTEQPIDRLSKSAQGEEKKQIDEDPRIILSNLKGHVAVKDGVAALSNISFSVPGAVAHMHGTFNLETKMVDLHGILDTTGELSDSTTSGFKALVLKAITPFYKKKRDLKVMPFHITGPYGHTSVGLDIGK